MPDTRKSRKENLIIIAFNYDKLAAGYDQALVPFEKRFLEKWREETLSHLPENAAILEIGAGTGANFSFYPPFKHAVASEISCKMLEKAREKINKKTRFVSLIQNNAEVLPFAENSFDAAFATLVFCSLEKPENAFHELKRVVRPNGKIVLLEHIRPPGVLGYLFDFLNIFTTALIADCFNRETAKLAQNAGLQVLDIKKKAFGIVNLIVCANV